MLAIAYQDPGPRTKSLRVCSVGHETSWGANVVQVIGRIELFGTVRGAEMA
jgi:hypothetical protein